MTDEELEARGRELAKQSQPLTDDQVRAAARLMCAEETEARRG
jgi:hypothetical protein